jgi:uncharacterized membrane protein (UPF0182 family)
MQPATQTVTETTPISKTSLWAGRVISALIAVFLIFDGVTKVIKVSQVMEAFARLGYPARLAPVIGIILLVCVAVYVVPRTSILGAILLTGYLGGATEVNLRAENPLFETLFPVIFGVLVWLGLYLRDRQLREVVSLRRPKTSL